MQQGGHCFFVVFFQMGGWLGGRQSAVGFVLMTFPLLQTRNKRREDEVTAGGWY